MEGDINFLNNMTIEEEFSLFYLLYVCCTRKGEGLNVGVKVRERTLWSWLSFLTSSSTPGTEFGSAASGRQG